MDILELFCDVDDFCHEFLPQWERYQITDGKKTRQRPAKLSMSEVMTIMIWFHASHYRDCKSFYLKEVWLHLRGEFPVLASYNRFVELMARTLGPLTYFLQTRQGPVTGISFVDSTPVAVCHHRRIASHNVFNGVAQRGKNSMGWFYGFKVHLIINERGDLLAATVTAGNVDDRKPVPELTKRLYGKLFGDRGYISWTLLEQVLEHGVQLVTNIKKTMKNRLMPIIDKILLRKRSLIETVNDQLKNISQIEHTRHRSLTNFFVNLFAGLVAYTYQEKKPSLDLTPDVRQSLYQLAQEDALVSQRGPERVSQTFCSVADDVKKNALLNDHLERWLRTKTIRFEVKVPHRHTSPVRVLLCSCLHQKHLSLDPDGRLLSQPFQH